MNNPRANPGNFEKYRATTAQIGRVRGPLLGRVEHLPCSFTVDDVATPSLCAQIAFHSDARDSCAHIAFTFDKNPKFSNLSFFNKE